MTDIDRVIKLNAMIARMSAIMIRVKGMEALNQSRSANGDSLGYTEHDFNNYANQIDLIVQAMENLYET